ncbi:exodeoxyribonuclease V subunit beta [Rubrivirga sp.]|uniref:exodeoxyribonuclease V subunit beta n=1 Tax=Rubrivirga sp. TaxID=1885344 RepID=UPI003B52C7F3
MVSSPAAGHALADEASAGASPSSASVRRPPDDVPPFEYWATPVEPGRTLVEASAGTGKTFAIAGLVVRLVLDGDWLVTEPGGLPDLRRLLVVTFTKAATEELRTRIRRALRVALAVARREPVPETSALASDLPLVEPLADLLARPEAGERLLAALDRVDEAGVFTIHSFCQRVLKQSAFESGTPFEMDFVEDSDSDALRSRAAADAWARLTHADPLLAALAVSRERTPDTLVQHHRATADFPSVRILPESPSLDDARDALAHAQTALAAVWSPAAVAEAVADVEWNKDAPLDGPGASALVARVGAFARGEDPDAFPMVEACTTDAVWKAGRKNGQVRKDALKAASLAPPFRACTDVMEAVAALDRAFTRSFVIEVGARIDAIKERRGQLTFNDLITRLHAALLADDTGAVLADGIRRQFSVALIDEFQDTDPLQYAIFRTAFEGRPLYFVGDPKQAIYAFRGADVHAYLGAQRQATRRFTLGTNWRSTAGLVEAVNRVFSGPERAFLFDGIPFRPVAPSPANAEPVLVDGDLPPLVWWPMPGEPDRIPGKTAANEAVPPVVAAEIRRLLAEARMRDGDGDRPLRPGEIAVLVPSKYEIQTVQQALHALGVPAVVSKAHDVRESPQIADLELILRAVLRPDDERALRAALATETWGWTADRIAALDDEPGAASALASQLRVWQKAWRRHGVLHVVADLQQREGVFERMLAFPDGERRVTNLRHAAELLHEVEAGGDRSPEDLAHWLRHRTEQALPSREMKEIRLERDDDAVTITTHHNAKGLEYEVVFLPYLWSLSERDTTQQETVLARTDAGVVYDLGSPEAAAYERLRQVDNLAEHVRKAYVAMTRARERCYVVWGAVTSNRKRLDSLSGLGYVLNGHDAPFDSDLATHVEAARRQAAEPGVLATARALDETGAVSRVVDPPAPDGRPLAAEPLPDVALSARALDDAGRRRVRDAWRRASFSAWSRGARDAASHDGGLAASDEADEETARTDAVPTGLHAFAAGTGPGTCLHGVLQHADWREGDEAEAAAERNRATVAQWLATYGLDRRGRPHRAPLDPAAEVAAMLGRVARAPLFHDADGAGLRLVDADARMPEWAFAVPLGRVAPRALADVFRTHGTPPFGADYADAVAALSRDAVDGLMVGEIDLVARADGRWWVVDWKSNRLGDDASAYTPDALAATMQGHHYGLQLHLYVYGLHRFLRSRLADYAYDTHVGGATYVFLRGLGENSGLRTTDGGSAPTGGSARDPRPVILSGAKDLSAGPDASDDRSRGHGASASRSFAGAQDEMDGGEEGEDSVTAPAPGLVHHRPSAALIDALEVLLAPDA